MPKKNDMLAQGTVDRCKMATLAIFFEQGDNRIRSISQLTRLAIETLEELLVEKLGIERITDTAEATRILKRLSYGSAFLESNKYASAALKNMNSDAENFEFNPLPQARGRKPKWSSDDEERMREAAEKALSSQRIQKLLEQIKEK
jgi:hypothetical protein